MASPAGTASGFWDGPPRGSGGRVRFGANPTPRRSASPAPTAVLDPALEELKRRQARLERDQEAAQRRLAQLEGASQVLAENLSAKIQPEAAQAAQDLEKRLQIQFESLETRLQELSSKLQSDATDSAASAATAIRVEGHEATLREHVICQDSHAKRLDDVLISLAAERLSLSTEAQALDARLGKVEAFLHALVEEVPPAPSTNSQAAGSGAIAAQLANRLEAVENRLLRQEESSKAATQTVGDELAARLESLENWLQHQEDAAQSQLLELGSHAECVREAPHKSQVAAASAQDQDITDRLEARYNQLDTDIRLLKEVIVARDGVESRSVPQRSSEDLQLDELRSCAEDALKHAQSATTQLKDLEGALGQTKDLSLKAFPQTLDSVRRELLEYMCRKALEQGHVMDLEKAVDFSKSIGLETDTSNMAIAELKDLSRNSIRGRNFKMSAFNRAYRSRALTFRKHLNLEDPGKDVVLNAVRKFLTARSHPERRPWPPAQIEEAVNDLETSVLNCAQRQRFAADSLTPTDWASYVWSAPRPILTADGSVREFFFLMNEAIREDDEHAIEELLPFIIVLNSVLVTRGVRDKDELWPLLPSGEPLRESFRGSGLPRDRLDWFKARGRRFRVPWALATGEKKSIAEYFAGESTRRNDKVPVLFTVTFPLEVDSASACYHVALLKRSITRDEKELLFVPYSKFEVVDYVEFCEGDRPFSVEITLRASQDNRGEEHLPLVEWM